MKLGITKFNKRISPRFEYSLVIELYEIKQDHFIKIDEVMFEGNMNFNDRMLNILNLNLNYLICGAITCMSRSVLEHNNIKVYSWISGNIKDVLNKFLKGQLSSNSFIGKICRRKKFRWKWQT